MIVLSIAMAASCSLNMHEDTGYGYLGFRISSDRSEDLIVKSATGREPAEDEVFAITVYNSINEEVASRDDHRTLEGDPIKLLMGDYKVVASLYEKVNAAFDKPFYSGSTNVRIYAGQTNTAAITCTLANSAVSAEFPDTFADYFSVYELSVSNGVGDPLVFSNSLTDVEGNKAGYGHKAYFAVTGNLEITLNLVNKDGVTFRHVFNLDNVKAKEHYKLMFTIDEEQTLDGGLIVRITLDNSIVETQHDIFLDFDNRGLPTYSTNSEFEIREGEKQVFTVGSTIPKVITFDVPAGMTSLFLSHNSKAVSEMGVANRIELVDADEATLTAVANAGISVSASQLVSGSKQASLDITSMVASMPIREDAEGYIFDLTAIDAKGHFKVCPLQFEIISDVDAQAVRATSVFAQFATLEGRYFAETAPEGMTFQYKSATGLAWLDVPAENIIINSSKMRFYATVTGLEPATNYVFRAVTPSDIAAGKVLDEVEFTTEIKSDIYNLNFDLWYQEGSAWYPNESSSVQVWDTANGGTKMLNVYPTVPETSDVKSGKAARLESMKAAGRLAAGNIYTGKFLSATLNPVGAKLNWGLEFGARPIALRGWIKYSPKAIDIVSGSYSHLEGQMDFCQVQIMLMDWNEQFLVSTGDMKFVDTSEANPEVIAHGELVTNESHSGYVQVTIPLVYRDLEGHLSMWWFLRRPAVMETISRVVWDRYSCWMSLNLYMIRHSLARKSSIRPSVRSIYTN